METGDPTLHREPTPVCFNHFDTILDIESNFKTFRIIREKKEFEFKALNI